jgi:hypothetical protein
MKKLGIVFAIAAVVAMVAIGVAGCASSGGGGKGGKLDRYVCDLTTFSVIKNKTAFTKIYDSYDVPFPEFPVDITQFRKITVRAKAYDAAGNDITAWSNNAIIRMVMSFEGEVKQMNPNVLFQELNCGFEGLGPITTNEGVPLGRPSSTPAGFHIENNSNEVKFIELTEVIFHNGAAQPPLPPGTFTQTSLDPFELVLIPNFQYGTGYQGLVRDPKMLNNYKLQRGDKLELTITFTVSRNLIEPLSFGWSNMAGGWDPLSWKQVGNEPAALVVPKLLKVGETETATIEFEILKGGGGGAAGNTLVIETKGVPAHGPVTVKFSQFVLKKVNNE